MNALAHVSPLEWFWIAASLLVVVLSLAARRDAMIDLAVLQAAGVNGDRRLVADNNIRQETIRLVVALMMLGLASLAFSEEWAFRNEASDVYLLILGTMTLLLGLASSLDKFTRRQLIRLYVPPVPIPPVTPEHPPEQHTTTTTITTTTDGHADVAPHRPAVVLTDADKVQVVDAKADRATAEGVTDAALHSERRN